MNSFKRGQILEEALEQSMQTNINRPSYLVNNIFDLAYSIQMCLLPSELVYDVIESVNPNLINKEVAECLYTHCYGYCQFFHGNMTPRRLKLL